MLAKILDLAESQDYDTDKISTREQYSEKIIEPTQSTCYSIQKQTFNPNTMVQIRFISKLDHGINFETKDINFGN